MEDRKRHIRQTVHRAIHCRHVGTAQEQLAKTADKLTQGGIGKLAVERNRESFNAPQSTYQAQSQKAHDNGVANVLLARHASVEERHARRHEQHEKRAYEDEARQCCIHQNHLPFVSGFALRVSLKQRYESRLLAGGFVSVTRVNTLFRADDGHVARVAGARASVARVMGAGYTCGRQSQTHAHV